MSVRSWATAGAVAILAVVYFVTAKLGLMLAFVHVSASAVWPPTGIALAAFLLLGYRVWPGVLLGAFLANLATEGNVATSMGIAEGNTLEALVGAYLANRFAGGRNAFERPQDVLRFAGLAGMASTTVSATVGVTSLSLGGFARWSDYGPIWLTWWLGDTVGALVVTPLLLLWTGHPRMRWDRRLLEAALLLACLVVVGLVVLGGWLPLRIRNYPLVYLCIPFLVWVAYRFDQRATATATAVLSGFAIWGTLHGVGPFARGTPHESLLLLQGFVGVTTVTVLVLAAAVAEARRGEEARFRLASIIESSDDAIIGGALDGTILSWNLGATELYGYTAEEVIGRPGSILAPRHRSDEIPRILERIRRGERIEPFETVRMTKDGRMIPISLSVSPITDANGQVLGASAIARDMSEQKRVNEAMKRAEAMLSVTRLANAAAHEINNPLAVIVGELELVAIRPENDAKTRSRVTRALESADRIREIVVRMQHITKLDLADQAADLPERLDLRKSASGSEKKR